MEQLLAAALDNNPSILVFTTIATVLYNLRNIADFVDAMTSRQYSKAEATLEKGILPEVVQNNLVEECANVTFKRIYGIPVLGRWHRDAIVEFIEASDGTINYVDFRQANPRPRYEGRVFHVPISKMDEIGSKFLVVLAIPMAIALIALLGRFGASLSEGPISWVAGLSAVYTALLIFCIVKIVNGVRASLRIKTYLSQPKQTLKQDVGGSEIDTTEI